MELLVAAHAGEVKFYKLIVGTAVVLGIMFGWMIGEYESSLSVDTCPCLPSPE